jgi:hypothetical protein
VAVMQLIVCLWPLFGIMICFWNYIFITTALSKLTIPHQVRREIGRLIIFPIIMLGCFGVVLNSDVYSLQFFTLGLSLSLS